MPTSTFDNLSTASGSQRKFISFVDVLR